MALTKQDKEEIRQMLLDNNRHVGYVVEDKVEAAKDELKAEMKRHRSDIMNHIDGFAGEIKTNQEERVTQSEQISRNTRRIEKLEKAVFS